MPNPTLEEFFRSLTESEQQQLLWKLRRLAIPNILTTEGQAALRRSEPQAFGTQLSPEQARVHERHAAALAEVAKARQELIDASSELARAKRAGRETPSGGRGQSEAQQAEVKRLQALVDERREAYDLASATEVKARPHLQKLRKAQGFKFPFAGRFRGAEE